MAALPDWTELLNCGLYGLEQYLTWSLLELRRLAVIAGIQGAIQPTYRVSEFTVDDVNLLQAFLDFQVLLTYDSELALQQGLNFLPAIKDISDAQSIIPEYRCTFKTADYMIQALKQINYAESPINSLEKFVYWLCLSWQLSVSRSSSFKDSSRNFIFTEGSNEGGILRFRLSIPLAYPTAFNQNFVCAATLSNNPESLITDYVFSELGSNLNRFDNQFSNKSNLDNGSNLGN